MPRGVTATFTAWLGSLTHPGTSVGPWGSPLIHPLRVLRGPNMVRPPDLRQCSFRHWTIPLVFDRWLPKRGTMFHPQPPARGFCQHGVAVGRFAAHPIGHEPNGLPNLVKCRFGYQVLMKTGKFHYQPFHDIFITIGNFIQIEFGPLLTGLC